MHHMKRIYTLFSDVFNVKQSPFKIDVVQTKHSFDC